MIAAPGADHAVESFFAAHHNPQLSALAQLVTQLGSTPVSLAASAAAAGALARRYRRSDRSRWRYRSLWPAVLFIVGELVVEVAARVVKRVVGRPRPPFEHALVRLANGSLPAAHVARATYWVLLVVVLVPPRRRRLMAGSGAAVVSAVAWSRLELGTAWLTDTIAGALLALIVAVAVVLAVAPARPRPVVPGHVLSA